MIYVGGPRNRDTDSEPMKSGPSLNTIKRIGAVLIALAIVLAAGVVVGQAPAIFGVDDEPEATIEFEDQQRDGTSVAATEVSVSDGGFVVITDSTGETVGVSDYLGEGTHENVTINQSGENDLEMLGQLTATVHHDSTDDETYAYEETDGEEDRPYIEDGYPVSDTATVTMADREETASDSFVVESIDAPTTATTNETIAVTAEIRNPTESVDQQHVDLRLDGAVLERQVLELEPDESTEIGFEASTSGSSPGSQTVGVYTTDDGAIEEIELEFHGTPGLDPQTGNESALVVDAEIPADGFVTVERADGDGREVVATSEEISTGIHENVTVDIEGNVSEDEELIVALYEGDPTEPETATQIEDDDGEPIETEVVIEEL